MTADIDISRRRSKSLARRFPVPADTVRAAFGRLGPLHVDGDLCYGAVAHGDGTHRFGWLMGPGALTVTDVVISQYRNVSLTADRTAAIVLSEDGRLVEVPLDGSGPRPLCDLSELGYVCAVAPLAEGWFAVYRSEEDDGPDLIALRPDGGGGIAEAVGYELELFEVMRSMLDGRVLVLATAEWDPEMLVLGFDGGRLRRLGTLCGELWHSLDSIGTVTVGPPEPCIGDGDRLCEITGLADAWAGAFGADDPAPDLPALSAEHRGALPAGRWQHRPAEAG